MMMKGSLFHHHEQQQQQEENMSNLTSASCEAASVSSGNRNELSGPNFHHQYFAPPPAEAQAQTQPLKRKRNLPGNPDPESEVIALSPKTLMATNRFICEICNKGFQRDQNLQLHRRGHNLPWKLKQRTNKEVIRKKVYVCPEVNCVHHDPSRALGDLTGIKKHFCRKHGEKKWKCDKCSKRYAVQSDWKAHSKVCGTREYRCDCGTLFSRRDSFITHRAFCDALAEESTRTIITPPPNPNPLLSTHQPSNLNLQIPHFTPQNLPSFPLKKEQDSFAALRPDLPPWLAPPPQLLHEFSPNTAASTTSPNPNPSPGPGSGASLGPALPQYHAVPVSPHMSATALLQKAAQMGATMSSTTHNKTAPSALIRPHHQAHVSADSPNNSSSFALNLSSTAPFHHGGANNGALFQEMMNSLSNSGSGFDHDAFVNGVLGNPKKDGDFPANDAGGGGGGGGGGEELTRDFLGLRAFSHSDILNMAGFGGVANSSSSSLDQQQQGNSSQKTWRG